jgi:hypothetical protein
MSYFDVYLNTIGEKTLRNYTGPISLKRFDAKKWRTTDEDLEFIADYLYAIKHKDILSKDMIANLSNASPLLLKASLLGSIPEGLFKPKCKPE